MGTRTTRIGIGVFYKSYKPGYHSRSVALNKKGARRHSLRALVVYQGSGSGSTLNTPRGWDSLVYSVQPQAQFLVTHFLSPPSLVG